MSKQSNLINDTIYNHIEYSEFEDRLLQTKVVNRLLFVTQNALAYFAYPSINTKRYIHSLGTMHLSAHIFKNSILNAKQSVRNKFLKNLKKSIEQILAREDIDLNLNELKSFRDNSLYGFMLPLKSQKDESVYFIALQAVRVVGLLHDVGHFPFSHQVEYTMQKLYLLLKDKESLNEKEKKFLEFYLDITSNDKDVLHEAIGLRLIKFLFEYELMKTKGNQKQKEYIKLIYHLVLNILNENCDGVFDYKVLHGIVDGTIDADRLDYVNRDMLSSGYISGGVDFIRITKQAVLIEEEGKFFLTFFDSEIIDIEHMLEMRFNLYKKIIYSHKISVTDALLENVILFLSQRYFSSEDLEEELTGSISMLWRFLESKDPQKKLDTISQLDENWMITLFKKEYFNIKYNKKMTPHDKKYLISFEEVLFGKKFYKTVWKNLNDLYSLLEFEKNQRYRFRESFGYVSDNRFKKLQELLDKFCSKYENENTFFTYRIVSLNIGIGKDFSFYDGKKVIKIDEISTLRKRLKKSILNTVPFYIYSNNTNITDEMKQEIKSIINKVFI